MSIRSRILEWAESRGRKSFSVHDATRISKADSAETRQVIYAMVRAGELKETSGHKTLLYTMKTDTLLSEAWRTKTDEELGLEQDYERPVYY